MAKRDGLSWHGGPPPEAGSEGMVTSVGVNTHRPRQAIDPHVSVPRRPPADPPRPTALDGGMQVEVRRLGERADEGTRPSGRVRLTRD